MSRIVRIVINGAEEFHDLDEILTIENPEAERPKCAADLAWWGAIWGESIGARERAESNHTHLKGKLAMTALTADAKASEWKVNAAVHASDQYIESKDIVAEALRQEKAAEAIFKAYDRRADILARLINKETTEMVRSGGVGSTSEHRAHPPKPGTAVATQKAQAAADAIARTRKQKTD